MTLSKLSLLLLAGGIVAITLGTVVHTAEPQPQPPATTPQAARYTVTAGPLTYIDNAQMTLQTFIRLDTVTCQAWAMIYVASGTNGANPDWVPVLERLSNGGPAASKAASVNVKP
jgi:hypothetical protein